MVEREQVFPLYSTDSEVLYVDLECNGERTTFLVDTGSHESVLGPEHLEKFGKTDEDLVLVDGSPCIELDVKLKGTVFPLKFFVKDFGANLLGMDILCLFSCFLNLQENTLTFRDYADSGKISFDYMIETATVEGQELEVMLDTGAGYHLIGTTETAKQLNLALQDISALNQMLETNYGPVPIEWGADEIRMKVRDREMGSGIYIVNEQDPEYPTVVGIPALNGALIQFYHDGTYDVSLSGELDKEEEYRVLEASNERIA